MWYAHRYCVGLVLIDVVCTSVLCGIVWVSSPWETPHPHTQPAIMIRPIPDIIIIVIIKLVIITIVIIMIVIIIIVIIKIVNITIVIIISAIIFFWRAPFPQLN